MQKRVAGEMHLGRVMAVGRDDWWTGPLAPYTIISASVVDEVRIQQRAATC